MGWWNWKLLGIYVVMWVSPIVFQISPLETRKASKCNTVYMCLQYWRTRTCTVMLIIKIKESLYFDMVNICFFFSQYVLSREAILIALPELVWYLFVTYNKSVVLLSNPPVILYGYNTTLLWLTEEDCNELLPTGYHFKVWCFVMWFYLQEQHGKLLLWINIIWCPYILGYETNYLLSWSAWLFASSLRLCRWHVLSFQLLLKLKINMFIDTHGTVVFIRHTNSKW